MRRPLLAASAALFVLAPVSFDLMQTWADSDLVPAWRESERKPDWPDGPVKDFLRGLQRPDNNRHPEREQYARLCCDAGDTVKTKFKVEPGDDKQHPEDRWYAWLNEKWIAIPPEKIVLGHAPDGQAYLFVTDFASEIEGYPAFKRIVCFVRPKGGI
jgi:hypothetical protein